MVLILHVIISIASLILGSFALSRLNQSLLKAQIATFGLTIISGVALVIQHPSTLTHLCVSGVVFSTISIAMIIATRQRLARPLAN